MASKKKSKFTAEERKVALELRAMTRTQVKALQKRLGLSQDGAIGGGTIARVLRDRREKTANAKRVADQKTAAARAATAKATAEAKRAEAGAKRAAAEALRIAAEAKAASDQRAERSKERKFQREQETAKRKAREATIGGLAAVTAAGTGVIVGKQVIAKGLDARFSRSVEAAKKPIAALAKDARAAIKAFENTGSNKPVLALRMKAMGETARRTLPASRSPLGLGFALSAGALGAFSLYRGHQEKEYVSKMAFNTSAALELGTAVGTVGQQIAARNNPIVAIPMNNIAAVRAAGDIGRRYKMPKSGVSGRSATSVGRAVAGTVVKSAAKVALPFMAVMVGMSIGSGLTSAKAAVRRGDTMGVAKAASNTVADIANTMTGGLTGLMERGLRYAISSVTGSSKPARVYLNASARTRASSRASTPSRTTRPAQRAPSVPPGYRNYTKVDGATGMYTAAQIASFEKRKASR